MVDADRTRPGQSVTFGLSLDRETADRLDLLLGVKPELRNRSELYLRAIRDGMALRFGPDWAVLADAKRELITRVPA